MPADYNIPMTDAQITEALQLMVERVSEGWAQETYDGSPVGSGSPYYHKSSKWWATQAADSAARAEAAVPAGTAGAVFFDRVQTLTDAQAMQARANIKAGSSNRNLLMNGWFTVNQRGITTLSTSTAQYTLDRWLASGTGSTITVNTDKSVTIAKTAGTLVFTQRTELPKDYTKVYTLSVLLSNGEIFSKTGVFNAGTQGETAYQPTGMMSFYLGLWTQGGYLAPAIYLSANQTGNLTIKAVKLELGSVSTLASDAPPNLAEELAKCQRYFIRLKGDASGVTIGVGYAVSTSSTRILIPTPTTMAKVPTLTFAGSSSIFLVGNGQKVSPSNIGLPAFAEIQKNGVSINAYYSGLTANQVYALIIEASTSYIDLSADL